MTVRELIIQLTYCNMDARVKLHTINTNDEGVHYTFELEEVDPSLVIDSVSGKLSIELMFNDWRMEKKG